MWRAPEWETAKVKDDVLLYTRLDGWTYGWMDGKIGRPAKTCIVQMNPYVYVYIYVDFWRLLVITTRYVFCCMSVDPHWDRRRVNDIGHPSQAMMMIPNRWMNGWWRGLDRIVRFFWMDWCLTGENICYIYLDQLMGKCIGSVSCISLSRCQWKCWSTKDWMKGSSVW